LENLLHGRTTPLVAGGEKVRGKLNGPGSHGDLVALGTTKLAGTAVQVESEAGLSGDTGVTVAIGRQPSPPLRKTKILTGWELPRVGFTVLARKQLALKSKKR
jgi:hypothetical protein